MLKSTLDLIKCGVDHWLGGSNDPGPVDLVALLDALDLWKKEIEQKLPALQATSEVHAAPSSITRCSSETGPNRCRRRTRRQSSPRARKRLREDSLDLASFSAIISDGEGSHIGESAIPTAVCASLSSGSQIAVTEENMQHELHDYVQEDAALYIEHTRYFDEAFGAGIGPEASADARLEGDESCILNLNNFDGETLTRVFHERPSEVTNKRCLRILQYVNAIGSPCILRSLKAAFDTLPKENAVQAVAEPILEKLLHFHLHLGNLEGQDHLLIARHRYIKYCYFETYYTAVKTLQEKKASSRRERKKISALMLTASYKEGFCEGLPPTPHTNAIDQTYQDFSDSEKRGKASVMVKKEIVRKVANVSKGQKERIREDINRYIREGEVLHKILQGAACVNPGLLLLFPSWESHPPSLDISQFGLKLQDNEQRSLSKPITLKDIDNLTQDEASWFAKVLQARPALLEPLPENVLALLSNSPTDFVHLQERDPTRFENRPLDFFR